MRNGSAMGIILCSIVAIALHPLMETRNDLVPGFYWQCAMVPQWKKLATPLGISIEAIAPHLLVETSGGLVPGFHWQCAMVLQWKPTVEPLRFPLWLLPRTC